MNEEFSIVGGVGRVSVGIDDGGSGYPPSAVFDMEDVFDDGPSVEFARVEIGAKCGGAPDFLIEFRTRSFPDKVLPQYFSTSRPSCIRIYFYGHSENGRFQLLERFVVRVVR
ncbi:MAG: hypothetical protein KF911_02215 [Pseudomonadales bacterium]|nr:hypothetical protein [Pseudomonadales bacterium]